MNLRQELQEYSEKFIQRIKNVPGVIEIETEDWGWENYRYKSSTFRLAHVEKYFLDNLLVLHITVFPHKEDPSAIFGFDIIGSEKTNIILGAFLDLSPILEDNWTHSFEGETNRTLPEWANIFSKNFIALKNPHESEYKSLLDFSFYIFDAYLCELGKYTSTEVSKIVSLQNIYCENQQKNKRTFSALKAKVGEERAKFFMENILFPKISLKDC